MPEMFLTYHILESRVDSLPFLITRQTVKLMSHFVSLWFPTVQIGLIVSWHPQQTLLCYLSRCCSSLHRLYQLSAEVIRSSPQTQLQAERLGPPLTDERDVKRRVPLEVDRDCDPQRCGPVIEDTLADTQPPR